MIISLSETEKLKEDDNFFHGCKRGSYFIYITSSKELQVSVTGIYNWSTSDLSGMGVWVAELYYDWKPGHITPPPQNIHSKYSNFEQHLSGSLGVAIVTTNAADYVVAVEIICQPILAAKQKWRLETHSKILEAYTQKLRDYQDALAAQRMSQPTTGPVGSTNPEINRAMEQTEELCNPAANPARSVGI